jgi:hypothetical protein
MIDDLVGKSLELICDWEMKFLTKLVRSGLYA